MSTVSPSQSNAGDLITAAAINNPVNQLAAVINGSIDATNIADGAVTNIKLANGAVTSTKVNFGGSGAGIWWEEIGRTTLSSSGTTISVTGLPARKYLQFTVTLTQVGLTAEYIQFNSDSGNNYAWRASVSGAADSANAAVVSWGMFGDTSQSRYIVGDISNVATSPKLGFVNINVTTAAGASVPARVEFAGKWSNTVDQITRIDYSTASGSFAAGAELIVRGHN